MGSKTSTFPLVEWILTRNSGNPQLPRAGGTQQKRKKPQGIRGPRQRSPSHAPAADPSHVSTQPRRWRLQHGTALAAASPADAAVTGSYETGTVDFPYPVDR